MELDFATIISEAGSEIRDVYFPTDSFISLLASLGNDRKLEVTLAGSEGVYGVPIALGVAISPVQAMVQGAGPALRMSAAAFASELVRTPALRKCVDRYTYVLMTQLVQTAGCNRFHLVEQRVARWLLMTADRAHKKTFTITHEFLAYMLGVRRVGVTAAARSLQASKLITYKRGIVTILDRKGLESAACPCYCRDLATYKRVLG